MASTQRPVNLRCEYRTNPLGIDVAEPRLSWQLEDARRGARQTAYQVRVSSSLEKLEDGSADVWDSQKVSTDQSIHVVYAGPSLRSRQRCWWQVRTWDAQGQPSAWSDAARWEMGLLSRTEWLGEWIGSSIVGGKQTAVPAPLLRKQFTTDKPVASARLYVTALGLYEMRLNGQAVGAPDVLTPGWTEYRKRVQYQVYDVTPLLQPGDNAIGAILGDGWYCGHVGGDPRQVYGDRPKLLAQLVLTFADDTTQTIATDSSWRTVLSPILESDLIMGESYDARLEIPGWDTPTFDDARWQPVETFADPGIALVPMRSSAVHRIRELKPIAPPTTASRGWNRGAFIFDLGQNMVGRVRIKVTGPAGTTLTIRHAEMLDKDGKLYTANLRAARATDYYTLKGGGEEVYEPRFTFHGFRYVEIEGLPHNFTLTPDMLTGIVLHSGMEQTGQFECSDPLLNQLQHNIEWGQRGNYLEVPTDCPQRDERLGWTGDAQVFIRTGAFNFNVAPFFSKWQQDLEDSQSESGSIPMVVPNPGLGGNGGPAWADAVMICPWTVYLCYGDTRLLQRHYASLRRFVDSLEGDSRQFIRSYEGCPWGGFGDWLALDGSGNNSTGRTPCELIGTAFYAYSTKLLANIAGILGNREDAARYQASHDNIRNAFIQRYLTPAGLIYAHTQTAYVLALHFDLLPEPMRAAAAEALVRDIKSRGNKLSTGFVGSPYLNHVLTTTGHLDVAYALLFQKQWPSWLYAVTQGATTIWERWDGWTHDRGFQDPGMNSFNHYAYGAIGAWLYATVAGIDLDPERPAYKHVIVRPRPPQDGSLTHAKAALNSMYGLIEAGWKRDGQVLTLDVIIPPNTTATVHVPAASPEAVTESGQPAAKADSVRFVAVRDGTPVYEVQAGHYCFQVRQ
jgi:alpha-L-rhamnosidase